MRRLWSLFATTGLGLALLLGGPSDAWAQWRGGWHGGGWHGAGWRGAGWGGGWHGGWRGAGWNRPAWGWQSAGWNRPGWGWNRGWGWGGGWWPATAGLGLGWAATSPYWGSSWGWGGGWPYYSDYGPSSYAYGYRSYPTYFRAYQTRPYYGYGQTYAYTRTTPLVTGRSVAAGNIGMHCATAPRTCLLKNASYVGVGCSCKVTGGRARGSVIP